jgi:hypothetical protein
MRAMRFLSFLLERDQAGKDYKLLHEVRMTDRLRVTACFWDAGMNPHRLEVVSQHADGSERVVGRFDGACPRGAGLLVVEGLLEPLRVGGWHRIALRLDGQPLGVSRPVFVLGPRRTRGRYLGRALPPGVQVQAPEPDERRPEMATNRARRRR